MTSPVSAPRWLSSARTEAVPGATAAAGRSGPFVRWCKNLGMGNKRARPLAGGRGPGRRGSGLRGSGRRGSSGSILSVGSSGSILSIGSSGSILSIGSAGSILSIGSVGSVAAVFSAFSAASACSVLSAGCRWSVAAWRASGKPPAVINHRQPGPVRRLASVQRPLSCALYEKYRDDCHGRRKWVPTYRGDSPSDPAAMKIICSG